MADVFQIEVSAIADELGKDLTPTQRRQVPVWIERATALLRRRVPTLKARAERDPELAGLARSTIAAAVVRTLRNPEGWRSVGLDDFQGVRDSVLSAGEIGFTDSEIAALQPIEYIAPSYSVPLGVPYWGA
ncbi:Uncharacterised protein [Actinobaculum suis]|uniref:Phage protein Gp19/Gp15/Gp42 n=1 Tax=Actinobaculum suis TaxID=1657 RepID=A0A7Z9CAI9_9ACTO|nr:hypothetical protein [Actinobaculum suis]VDG77347.1 Uncharacterised protein [Actinobaculum suis]